MEKESSSRRNLTEGSRHRYYRSHLVQYGLLILAFVLSIWVISQADSRIWKIAGVSFLSVFYFIFGLFHHFEEGEISWTHVFEYLIIASVIFIILFSLFVR